MKFLGMSVNSIDQLNQVLKAEFERRDSDRYAMRTRVETKPVDVPDTYRLQAYSPTSQQDAPADIDQMFGRDISTKGMRLLSDKPYLPGNQLEVHMKFKLGYQLMKANTIVRWCKEDAKLKRFELGIEFTDLDDTSSDFLTSLVSYARR